MPKTTEIVYTYLSGKEEVHYSRPYGSADAKKLMKEVDELPQGKSYSYRHIDSPTVATLGQA